MEAKKLPDEGPMIADIVDMLGGARVLGRKIREPLEAHDLLIRGLPHEALTHLVGKYDILRAAGLVEKAIGLSQRTLQRHNQRQKEKHAKPLNQEQSSRIWKFAEILAKATMVLGSKDDAEEWLQRPAIGLDSRRPIDLLATAAGVEIVETYLDRLEYGVYA